MDIRITKSVLCDMSKSSLYMQIKTPLVDRHAFPLMGFVYETPTLPLVAAV